MSREWVEWAERAELATVPHESYPSFRREHQARRVLRVIAAAADSRGYAAITVLTIANLLATELDPLVLDDQRVRRLTQELAIWGALERVRSRKAQGRGFGVVGYQLLGNPKREQTMQAVAHAS